MLSRRTAIRGALAATAAVTAPSIAMPRAEADVPRTTAHFDLRRKVGTPLGPTRLHSSSSVLQSFAFDPVTHALYTVQVAGSGADLFVTHAPGTQYQSFMRLNGFGHGVTLGVERDEGTSQVYLWVESQTDDEGRGTRIARVKWRSGATVNNWSAGVQQFNPNGPNAAIAAPRPVLDQLNNLLVVRTSEGDYYRFRAWPLAAARAGRFTASEMVYTTRLANPYKRISSTLVPQGTAVYGQWIYLWHGKARTNNATLFKYKIANGGTSGGTSDRALVTAYPDLSLREPEGIAILRPRESQPALCFGFATGSSGDYKAVIGAMGRQL